MKLFFIFTYVVALLILFPKWAHLPLISFLSNCMGGVHRWAEWPNGPYLRGGKRNDASLEQRNAVADYPSGDGIWKSIITEFGMKL